MLDLTMYKTVSATVERTTTKDGKSWVEIIAEDSDGNKIEITLFDISELKDITEE